MLKRILVIDDLKKNLETAMLASENFVGDKKPIEFIFLNSASTAFRELDKGGIDGVVTDLFLPREDSLELKFNEYINVFDKCDLRFNPYKMRKAHDRLVLTYSPFAAYGALIALNCFKWEIPIVIITNMHRHIENVDNWIIRGRTCGSVDEGDPARNADATLILAPLIEKRFLNIKDIMKNYHPLHYLGGYGVDKHEKKIWIRAIKMCLKQETVDNRPRVRQEELKRIEEKKKLEQQKKELISSTLTKNSDGIELSDRLLQIVTHLWNAPMKIVDSKIAIIKTSRTESHGYGLGYWDQVVCINGDQCLMKEWNWRHHKNAKKDNPYNSVNGFGDTSVVRDDDSVTIKVELENSRRNRFVEFKFEKPKSTENKLFTAKEKNDFIIRVKSETSELIKKLRGKDKDCCEDWNRTNGQIQSRVMQSVINLSIGVAAVIVRTQVGYRYPSEKLYVLKKGQEGIEGSLAWTLSNAVNEDAEIFILELSTNQITMFCSRRLCRFKI